MTQPASPSTTVFYVTTPIYYVNSKLHIGGAYTTLVADTLARYHRLQGHRTFFLTGSDEHGQKIANVAQAQGKTPQELADSIVPYFKELWKTLDITHDLFIRTTDRYHERVVQSFFQKLLDNRLIYKGTYRTLYCTGCEKPYSLSELEDGKCPIHKVEPDKLEEENYFLRVLAVKEKLRAYLKAQPPRLLPEERANKVLADLDDLDDQSVSRRKDKLSWGVPMPHDKEHVVWVWFDALINYVSALLKEEVEKRDHQPDPLPFDDLIRCEKFRVFWPECVHLIGKDILWHHTLIWWAMLLGVGVEPPKLVFAHGWWTVEGGKISKSLGTAVDPNTIVKRFGNDALRYYVLREMSFGKDGDFSVGQLASRINSDLGKGGVGNLISRTLQMVEKFRGGKVPAVNSGALLPADADLAKTASAQSAAACGFIENYQFHFALDALWKIVRHASQYIDEQAPWKLAKDAANAGRLDNVLYHLCETCRLLMAALEPIIPDAAKTALKRLGQSNDTAPLRDRLKWGRLAPGTNVEKGESLFPAVDSALEVTAEFTGAVATVKLTGFLDGSTAPVLEAALADVVAGKSPPSTSPTEKGTAKPVVKAAQKPTSLRIDLGGLAYATVGGLRGLKQAKAKLGALEFLNRPDNFDDLLTNAEL